MTVALQRVSSKEQIAIHRTRVPFRVMVLYGLSEYHGESNPVPANPFMEEARAQQQVRNLRIVSRKNAEIDSPSDSFSGLNFLIKSSEFLC